MARYEFYEVRSARTHAAGEAVQTPGGVAPLQRTSYSCAERGDMVLFAWRGERGEIAAWQLLFGERFIEWSAAAPGLAAGVTDRSMSLGSTAEPIAARPIAARPIAARPDQPLRVRGVRTLQRASDDAGAAILAAARALLDDAVFPIDVDAAVRAALGDAATHYEG